MLTTLTTRSFRNLADQSFAPVSGANLVYGPNGAGKSSLLEAAYLAATTRSFRTPRLKECCRLGDESLGVSAEVDGDERVRLEVSWGPEGKRRAVNGKAVPIVEHLSVLPIVSWTARDNEIFQGPPAVRRLLLDRGIVSEQPACLLVISEYRRALEAKRAALDGQGAALEEWNRLLARHGAELAARRARFVGLLEGALNDVLERSDLDLGGVELRYRPSPAESLGGEDDLFGALAKLSRRELARRVALAGPHRDDVDILWRNGPVGRMASAGERKALGLALMVAQARLVARRGPHPLCLIDDFDAELDHRRVGELWKLLGGASQLVAATSRNSVVNELSAKGKWSLEGGNLANLRQTAEKSL